MRNFYLIILFFISAISTAQDKQVADIIPTNLKWSERMALSILKRHPEAYQIDEKTEPKWDYVHGLVLKSFEDLYNKTSDNKYYDYIKGYADATINEEGTIGSYKIEKYNIDMVTAGRILFSLYDKTKDEKYMIAMKLLRKQLQEQPRTASGGFWHKKIYLKCLII